MRPVIVVGMHRSGTSATARVLNLLGLPTVPESDLMIPNHGNPDGYWESTTLSDFDDLLLSLEGASWSSPPPLPAAGEERSLSEFKDAARTMIGRLFEDRTAWVWKDPRASLLLGLWRAAVPEATFVLVHRDPLDVASSLSRRDGLSRMHGLALWQRYVGSCLRGLTGAPVAVVAFEDLRTDPAASVRRLASHLETLGVPVAWSDSAWQSIRAAEPHKKATLTEPPRVAPGVELPPETVAMRERLRDLDGVHASFPVVALAEGDWVESQLAAHRGASLVVPDARLLHDDAVARRSRVEVSQGQAPRLGRAAPPVEAESGSESDPVGSGRAGPGRARSGRATQGELEVSRAEVRALLSDLVVKDHFARAMQERIAARDRALAVLATEHFASEEAHRQLQLSHDALAAECARLSTEAARLSAELACVGTRAGYVVLVRLERMLRSVSGALALARRLTSLLTRSAPAP